MDSRSNCGGYVDTQFVTSEARMDFSYPPRTPRRFALRFARGWPRTLTTHTGSAPTWPVKCWDPTHCLGHGARDQAYSKSFTIAGGTTQIYEQIIAQRILAMPRDR